MSLLKTIDPNPTFAPRQSTPMAERLIAGSPTFKTWARDAAKDKVLTGVWGATPGENRLIKGGISEFCPILAGVIEITRDDGEPAVHRAGGSFAMKPGCTGVRKTIETGRKIHITVS